ncbi:hypothetical protein BDW69DRAFT_186247 [Aspergillus filifer]
MKKLLSDKTLAFEVSAYGNSVLTAARSGSLEALTLLFKKLPIETITAAKDYKKNKRSLWTVTTSVSSSTICSSIRPNAGQTDVIRCIINYASTSKTPQGRELAFHYEDTRIDILHPAARKGHLDIVKLLLGPCCTGKGKAKQLEKETWTGLIVAREAPGETNAHIIEYFLSHLCIASRVREYGDAILGLLIANEKNELFKRCVKDCIGAGVGAGVFGPDLAARLSNARRGVMLAAKYENWDL